MKNKIKKEREILVQKLLDEEARRTKAFKGANDFFESKLISIFEILCENIKDVIYKSHDRLISFSGDGKLSDIEKDNFLFCLLYGINNFIIAEISGISFSKQHIVIDKICESIQTLKIKDGE